MVLAAAVHMKPNTDFPGTPVLRAASPGRGAQGGGHRRPGRRAQGLSWKHTRDSEEVGV